VGEDDRAAGLRIASGLRPHFSLICPLSCLLLPSLFPPLLSSPLPSLLLLSFPLLYPSLPPLLLPFLLVNKQLQVSGFECQLGHLPAEGPWDKLLNSLES
jgi:hypothetical protein